MREIKILELNQIFYCDLLKLKKKKNNKHRNYGNSFESNFSKIFPRSTTELVVSDLEITIH